MSRRKRSSVAALPTYAAPHVPADTGWVKSGVYTTSAGKRLTPGTVVTIRGERGGRFRFMSHTRTPDGREWLDMIGGPDKVNMWRSFRPDRISRVFGGKRPAVVADTLW